MVCTVVVSVTIYIHMPCVIARSIWAICGTGYLLDIMWAQAFPLAIANIQRELGFSDKEFGNLGISFVAGLGAGSLMWGTFIDVVG